MYMHRDRSISPYPGCLGRGGGGRKERRDDLVRLVGEDLVKVRYAPRVECAAPADLMVVEGRVLNDTK